MSVAIVVLLTIGFVWRANHKPTVSNEITQTAHKTAASNTTKRSDPMANLPSINYFKSHPSDHFLVDMDVVGSGHPYKGKRAAEPHTGAHVHFEDDYKTWPRGGTAPSNYPPIYAVADGVVDRITNSLKVGQNDRYGIDIAIAKDGETIWDFEYSIEPMIPEPSPNYYLPFMLVKEGDKVRKGQIIGYMLTPKEANGTHIHFELKNSKSQQFTAPAIFSSAIVKDFYDHGKNQWQDGGASIPACMGWKLAAEENPFENKAVDCL